MANFNFTKNDALVIGSACFGVACLIYAFRCNDELGLISSKVDISLKKLTCFESDFFHLSERSSENSC